MLYYSRNINKNKITLRPFNIDHVIDQIFLKTKRKLTRKILAEEMEVNYSSLNEMNSRGNCTVLFLFKISLKYKVSLDQLVYKEIKNEPNV